MDYQKLFEYMKDEHGVTLLESDMQEIQNIVCGHESEQCNIPDIVRSVFTIHSTEEDAIIKIVGTEEDAKNQVKEFKKQHKYADFFYEKQNIS